MCRCAPRISRFAITGGAASFRAMQVIALLSSALALFDAAPAAKPNPEFNPVVLVHGIHSNSRDMTRMARHFRAEGREVFTPDLTPNGGQATIEELGKQLANYAKKNVPRGRKFDLVGFSMGGLVSRYYVQRLGGAAHVPRGRKFDLVGFSMGGLVSRYYVQRLGGAAHVAHLVTIAAPHHGTILARLSRGAGAVEMRRDSAFLRELAKDDATLSRVKFTAFYTPLDLVVMPASSAEMPQARNVRVWASLHPSLILEKRCIRAVAAAISG